MGEAAERPQKQGKIQKSSVIHSEEPMCIRHSRSIDMMKLPNDLARYPESLGEVIRETVYFGRSFQIQYHMIKFSQLTIIFKALQDNDVVNGGTDVLSRFRCGLGCFRE